MSFTHRFLKDNSPLALQAMADKLRAGIYPVSRTFQDVDQALDYLSFARAVGGDVHMICEGAYYVQGTLPFMSMRESKDI